MVSYQAAWKALTYFCLMTKSFSDSSSRVWPIMLNNQIWVTFMNVIRDIWKKCYHLIITATSKTTFVDSRSIYFEAMMLYYFKSQWPNKKRFVFPDSPGVQRPTNLWEEGDTVWWDHRMGFWAKQYSFWCLASGCFSFGWNIIYHLLVLEQKSDHQSIFQPIHFYYALKSSHNKDYLIFRWKINKQM